MEFLPGKDGICHISKLANIRVKQVEDIVQIGDEIWVNCLGVDEKGRVRLSRKAAMAERDQGIVTLLRQPPRMIRSAILQTPREQALDPPIRVHHPDRRHATCLGATKNNFLPIR